MVHYTKVGFATKRKPTKNPHLYLPCLVDEVPLAITTDRLQATCPRRQWGCLSPCVASSEQGACLRRRCQA